MLIELILEDVHITNEQERKIRHDAGLVCKLEIFEDRASCVFERCGTKFIIVLQSYSQKEYLVSIPNFYFSILTTQPNDIAYKLVQNQVMSRVDGESVEMAVTYIMSQMNIETTNQS